MKKWILLIGLAILFFFLVVRERYSNYEEALKDVEQQAGYVNPTCSDPDYVLNSDYTECTWTKPDGTKDIKPPTCPEGTAYGQQGDPPQGVCQPTSTGPEAAETTASTPASATSDTPVCPDGFRLAINEKCVRESSAVNGACNVGTLSGDKCYETVEPTCPAGKKIVADKCVDIAASTSSVTGSTTGGSSTSSRGSTATTGSGKGVWGPAFAGVGEGPGPVGGDSTKTTQYPTLLGGFMGGKPSSMVPGVGLVSPSTPGLSLPSSASLGADANSGYLPYSRQPGDMDVIPDPYRLSKSYSASNYSSKRSEPVPFLTDFSAFMK